MVMGALRRKALWFLEDKREFCQQPVQEIIVLL
jgi:hypothetical protein